MADPKRGNPGYEVQDANLREVVVAGIGVVAGTFLVCLLVWGLFNAMKKAEATAVVSAPASDRLQFPPEPRVEEHPWEQIREVRRQEDEVLKTYGWVDRTNGKVRIPIDRAMDIVAQHGLPVRGGGNAPAR